MDGDNRRVELAMTRSHSCAVLVLTASGLTCVDPPATSNCGDETIEGERVEFSAVGHDFGEYCPTGFDAAEAHIQWVAEIWGVEPPSSIHYGLFESTEHSCWPCASENLACASSEAIATTILPDRHELTHLAHGAPCFTLVEEGVAVLYSDGFLDLSTKNDLIEAVTSAEGHALSGDYYPLAARFAAFLIETHGIDALRELCETTAPNIEGFEAGLVAVYGQTLEALAEEYAATPQRSLAQLRQDIACDKDTDIVVSPGSWSHVLGCEGEGVEGRSGHSVWTHQLVELTEPGDYWFEFHTDAEVMLSVTLDSCQREGMASTYSTGAFVFPKPGEPGKLLFFDFEPGVYVVRSRLDDWLGDAPNIDVSVYGF